VERLTFREWNALILLTGQALVSGWLAQDAMGREGSLAEISSTLLWAIGLMVAFNVAGIVIVTVIVSLARREALKDEKADERDRAVIARSMRNAYFVLSIGGAGTLVLLALGATPVVAAYSLFAALMSAGATDSISTLVYYRTG